MTQDNAFAVFVMLLIAMFAVAWVSYYYGYHSGLQKGYAVLLPTLSEYNTAAHQSLHLAQRAVALAKACTTRLRACYYALNECRAQGGAGVEQNA